MDERAQKLALLALFLVALNHAAVVVLTAETGSLDAGSKLSGLDDATDSPHGVVGAHSGPLNLSRSGVVGTLEHSPVQSDLSLYNEIYTTANLFTSWLAVRRKARASAHGPTKARAHEIDENPIRFVRSLQRKLRDRTFQFPKQRAVVKTGKSGKKRGIVVSPIEGRVVQRAILEVLQSERPAISGRFPELRSVLECPTSVGGIPKRGVQHGVSLIRAAIQDGAIYYTRSDIKSFFDKVDRAAVVRYIGDQIRCPDTLRLIQDALTVDFENEEQVREELSIFPVGDIGVAQGNSLSCLAANVALREFDRIMTGRGVTTIRYVDDFVVLGKSAKSVTLALAAGIRELNSIGLTAYTPEENAAKATRGKVAEGFSFVGCHFDTANVTPALESRIRIMGDVDKTLSSAKKTIAKGLNEGKPRRSQDGFIQTLAALDRKLRGWGDAYQFTTDRSVFAEMDRKLANRIELFRKWFSEKSKIYDSSKVQRAYGVAVLQDTPTVKGTGKTA